MSKRWEVVQCLECPDAWIVEAIDHDSEGEVYAAEFSGHGAHERALEYSAWKNGGEAIEAPLPRMMTDAERTAIEARHAQAPAHPS